MNSCPAHERFFLKLPPSPSLAGEKAAIVQNIRDPTPIPIPASPDEQKAAAMRWAGAPPGWLLGRVGRMISGKAVGVDKATLLLAALHSGAGVPRRGAGAAGAARTGGRGLGAAGPGRLQRGSAHLNGSSSLCSKHESRMGAASGAGSGAAPTQWETRSPGSGSVRGAPPAREIFNFSGRLRRGKRV